MGFLFGRNFFVWLAFFLFCLSTVSGLALFERWRSTRELEEAQTHLMAARLSADFAHQSRALASPGGWEWKTLFRGWREQFPTLLGIALEDRADGKTLQKEGQFDENWIPLYGDSKNTPFRSFAIDSGERVWTVLPGGTDDPRYRLWTNLGVPTTFGAYLERRRTTLAIEFAVFFLLFVFFYWRFGSPLRHLKPMVETLGRALEHADSPLQVPLSLFPSEYVPLGKSVSLILEARRTEFEERERLLKRVGLQTRQKDQYSRMIKSLETEREHELTASESIQAALLESNREPAILLDRTRRILLMNDSARRILSLSGQTGYPLRHSELEAILQAHLEPSEDSPKDRRVSIRDPYQGKSSLWSVDVSVHHDWKDPSQIHCILVSLHRDNGSQKLTSQSPEHLLRLMAEAWAESWTAGAETPHPLSEEERSLLDALIRDLHAPGTAVEPATSIRSFGLEYLPERHEVEPVGEVGGTREGWSAFGRWFGHVLDGAARAPYRSRWIHSVSGRLRIEWSCEGDFALKDWFISDQDRTRSFRRELLGRCLEKLRAKLHWDPEEPHLVCLEILLKAPLVTGQRAPGIPLKSPV